MSDVRLTVPSSGRTHPRALTLASFLILAGATTACDTGPTGPRDGPPAEFLAGGGRASDQDAFVGGFGDSGPGTPDEAGAPEPYPWFPVTFYSETNCFGEPFESVIDTKAAWDAWLTTATSCTGDLPTPRVDGSVAVGAAPYEPDQPPPVGLPTEPADPSEPPDWGGPVLDFETSAVVVIGLEDAAGWGRYLQVAEVSTTGNLTHVRFDVSTPGEDCWAVLMGPYDPAQIRTSPVVAVIVPRPIGDVLAFERTDSVWHCIIEPDPTIPLTLYYTDGPCDLGADQFVIRTDDSWETWLDTAADCDLARWGNQAEPALPEGVDSGGGTGSGGGTPGGPGGGSGTGGGTVEPGVPVDPPIGWLSPDVDFATHAVVVLRAPAQTRWGGGVWLSAIEEASPGTTVDYWVITPGPDCPTVEGGATLRPTVAIRVPLPLPEPVQFRRNTETVECRWEVPVGGPDGGGGGGGGSVGSGGGPVRPDSAVVYPAPTSK